MAKTADSQNGAAVDVSSVIANVTSATEAAEKARVDARQTIETRLAQLNDERETLVAQLRSLGGKAGPRKARASSGKRASNDVTLIAAVAACLSKASGPMKPTEICEAVQKGGYQTTSDNYPQMVSQALSTLKGLRMDKSPVALNPNRGEWIAGSGMARYIANPDNAVEA